MAETLLVRKIFVDSRFKAAKSNSHSDFEYEIPQSVSLPDNTICYLENIVIPNSWKKMDTNNQLLYVRYTTNGGPQNLPMASDRIISLTPKNYNTSSLRAESLTNFSFMGTDYTIGYGQVLLRYKIDTGAPSKN